MPTGSMGRWGSVRLEVEPKAPPSGRRTAFSRVVM